MCPSERRSSSSICFASSASMMKTQQQQPLTLSLSSSINKRLRSASVNGGQSSPLFPIGNKRRGCGFDNSEPSSPKVTCIGQVRVKKQGKKKKMRSRSRSRRNGDSLTSNGNQECLSTRNQKWVHLPLTICEALRGFRADFNCFLPCGSGGGTSRSSSTTTITMEREEKAEKRRPTTTSSSSSSCGAVFARWLMAIHEGERREMSYVVRDKTEEEEDVVVDVVEEESEIEIGEDQKLGETSEIEDERMTSVCVPPRNALLLMRCRSEPFRVSSLANRFWDSPSHHHSHIEEEDSDEDEDGVHVESESEEEDLTEHMVEEANPENQQLQNLQLEDLISNGVPSFESLNQQNQTPDSNLEEIEVEMMLTEEKGGEVIEQEEIFSEQAETKQESENEAKTEELERESEEALPDCLLMMMMFEPKLSMEVSKETWVCKKDFIRSSPKVIQISCGAGDQSTNPKLKPDDSSSPTLPSMIEEKLVNAVAYEPFVLTRCKSEPLRTSAKLVPEACFWKNRKLEPQRISIGAATGVGF